LDPVLQAVLCETFDKVITVYTFNILEGNIPVNCKKNQFLIHTSVFITTKRGLMLFEVVGVFVKIVKMCG